MKWKLILYRVEKRIFLFDPNLIFALNTYYISWKSLALRYRTRIKQISREKEEF